MEASIVFYTHHNLLGHVHHCTLRVFQFSSLASFTAVTGVEDVSPTPFFALFSQRGSPQVVDCECWSFWSRLCALVYTLVLSILTLTGIRLDCPPLAAAVTAPHVSSPGLTSLSDWNTGARAALGSQLETVLLVVKWVSLYLRTFFMVSVFHILHLGTFA